MMRWLPFTALVCAATACTGPTGGTDAGVEGGDAGIFDGGRPIDWDGGTPLCQPALGPCQGSDCLRLNEAVAKNTGIWIDEALQTDDFVELVNLGDTPIELGDYFLGDDPQQTVRLAAGRLAPQERRIIWLDDDQDQGPRHLPFKLSSKGDQLLLWHLDDGLIDCWDLPALSDNQVMARFPDAQGVPQVCDFSSPTRINPTQCGPAAPPVVDPHHVYATFDWPASWPQPDTSLRLNEAALRQTDAFVELWAAASIDLSGVHLELATHRPGADFPAVGEGQSIPLPARFDAMGLHRVAVPTSMLTNLAADPQFEGVLTLFAADNSVLDRVDFMHWPVGASLARRGDGAGAWRLCASPTPGASNTACDPLAERPIGDRLRRLLTASDLARLAQGGRALGMQAVKVVVDRDAGGVVHLLSAARWSLHYTFVSEVIDGERRLDRCDPDEAAIFRAGWGQFSDEQYREIEGRRYLLGTLVRYSGNALQTLEFTTGDRITSPLIIEAFWGLANALFEPDRWAVRPQSSRQHDEVLQVEGSLPLVAINAPFIGLTEQPLNAAVGYGLLRFIPYHELDSAQLGPQVIVITDHVPNELSLAGGLITEAFQTPLAHVNLLARNRGTPNLALKAARQDPRVAPLLNALVRLEVNAGGFNLRQATAEEAQAFWTQRQAGQPILVPRQDLELRGVQPLSRHGLEALPALGAKAAQLAQLSQFRLTRTSCPGPVRTPQDAFALPLVHSLDHFAASGAAQHLDTLLVDPEFLSNPERRAEGLAAVRRLVLEHPVDAALLATIEQAIETRFGQVRVRLRSSSNTEDLPGFNGAGLYHSVSAELGDESRRVDDGLRAVWASLWSSRAYDERAWFRVDQTRVGMGVLVHRAFRSEQANGVAISRNVLDPNRGDIYFLNVQAGEASITNPAPGVRSESLLYRFGRSPAVVYQSQSSLTRGAPVLQTIEVQQAICTLAGIHSAFRPLLDPERENRYFAMDIEFKFIGSARELLVKQARPFSFGSLEPVGDCREF